MIPVETPWWRVALDLLDHWQTLIAGILAVLAAVGTIWATIRSAGREIAASQAQTAVAQKQIETTLRLERRRAASEGYAFHAMFNAAMSRVLTEAAEANDIFTPHNQVAGATVSKQAYDARTHFTKTGFDELRAACVRYGGLTTAEFLELESKIDDFASHYTESQGTNALQQAAIVRSGLHADFQDHLDVIKAIATHIRDEAAAGMKRANAVIAETEAESPNLTLTSEEVAGTPPKSSWRRRLFNSLFRWQTLAAGVLALLAAFIAGFPVYYATFHQHRAILLAIAPKPPTSGAVSARSDADLPFIWSPIISNDGNRTEVVPSICIAVGYSGPMANNTHQSRGALAGSFVLKGGDAVAVPVTFNFDKLVSLPGEDEVYVRVIALSPRDGIIAVDIPVLHITMTSQSPSEVAFTEKLSAGYNEGLIDIFSSPKSAFSYSGPGLSETQFTLPSIQFK